MRSKRYSKFSHSISVLTRDGDDSHFKKKSWQEGEEGEEGVGGGESPISCIAGVHRVQMEAPSFGVSLKKSSVGFAGGGVGPTHQSFTAFSLICEGAGESHSLSESEPSLQERRAV